MERSDSGNDAGHGEGGAGEVLDAVEAEQQEAVWAAWRSLPDESRSLLWRLVVHEEKPHQMAPGLGTTPSGVATLAKHARKRLRQTLLAELAARTGEAECRAVRRRLGGYVRDSLPLSARHHIDEHLDGCARCRAAVLDVVDVDAAIRLRVAPALLPGAFAAAEGASVPVAVGLAPTTDGADPVDDSPVPVWVTTGRVLSVPARSAAVVLAAAALVLAASLFLLRLEPSGPVTAEAPLGPGSTASTASGASADGAEPAYPTRGASAAPNVVAPGPVIGVATAQGVSRFQPSGGRTGNAGTLVRQGSPSDGAASSTSAPKPTETSQVSPSPANPSPSASSPRSTTTAPPSRVGTVTRLRFAPDDRGYLAHLAAPAGWLITSVQDVRGNRVREHVGTPTSVFDGRLGAGDLVVVVTRVRPDLTGALKAVFTSRTGALLPGSGDYPLR